MFRQADAQELPFEDGAFDVVVCQFGVMFFPGKHLAFAEARRVLAPGGALVFSVWDRIEENEFADVVTAALVDRFPEAPPPFLARTPHGYHQPDVIARDLGRGGFRKGMAFETLTSRSRAASPEIPAIAYCQGTPLRDEIEVRGAGSLARATRACADAIAEDHRVLRLELCPEVAEPATLEGSTGRVGLGEEPEHHRLAAQPCQGDLVAEVVLDIERRRHIAPLQHGCSSSLAPKARAGRGHVTARSRPVRTTRAAGEAAAGGTAASLLHGVSPCASPNC